jgi:hypothetical protein
MFTRHGFLAAAAVLTLAVLATVALGRPQPHIAGCRVLPRSNSWNQPVDRLPVAPGSNRQVRAMHRNDPLFADFTIPYTVVTRHQAKKRVHFFYDSESDRGPYPIPADVPIEPGVDRHAVILDRDSCRLYELYKLRRRNRHWQAGSGAIWDLRSNRLRPRRWTSADAAGLAILPGLVRADEVAAGDIRHAIRFTADETRAAFVYPARHYQGHDRRRRLPPMGLRMRLKGSVDITRFPPQAQVILRALQRYGMILADEGKAWFISGAPSPDWDRAQLDTLGEIKGSDFEVVDTRSLPRPGLRNARR